MLFFYTVRELFSPLFAFLHHLPLVAIVALAIALASGLVARGLGIHLLVWHELRYPRFAAGFALTVLVGQTASVGFLVDRHEAGLDAYVLTVATTVYAISLFALYAVAGSDFKGVKPRVALFFPLGALAGGLLVVGLLALRHTSAITPFNNLAAGAFGWLSRVFGVTVPHDPELDAVVTTSFVLLGGLFGIGSLDHTGRRATPVLAVSLALALGGTVYAFGAFWLSSWIPLAALGLAVLTALLWNAGRNQFKVGYQALGSAKLADYETLPAAPVSIGAAIARCR